MDSQLECLDIRLKQQEQEVGDLVELLRKRGEIERKYSKELESLHRTMRNKHKDLLAGTGASPSANNLLKQLILETGELAKLHGGLDEVMSGELTGICNNVLSDAQLQHKACKLSGVDIQENVLRSMYDLQNNSKLFSNNKSQYEQAAKKLKEAEKEKEKLEKDVRPEKLEKSKKYNEKKKACETKQDRKQKAFENVQEVGNIIFLFTKY